jgi:hypothetical protein
MNRTARARFRPAFVLGGLMAAFAATTCGEANPASSPQTSTGTATTSPGAGGGAGGVSTSPTGSGGGSSTGGGGAKPDAGSAGHGPCGQVDRPDAVPPDWQAWTGWSCDCPYWIPPSADRMPDPIIWVPCDPPAPPGVVCKQMADKGLLGTGKIRFGYDQGKLLAQFVRFASTWSQAIVAEVDGAVRFAMTHEGDWRHGCFIDVVGVAGGRFGWAVYGDGSTEDYGDSNANGLFWGAVGEITPRVAPVRDDTEASWEWRVGEGWWSNGIAPALSSVIYSPDFSVSKQIWPPDPPDPDGLPANWDLVVGKDVFIQVGGLEMSGMMAYDEVRGTHSLLRYYGESKRGVGNFGTDGKALVWTYGEGNQGGIYATTSIMTAPYTTDPETLKPRRLRSDPLQTMTEPFAVGCGYAAHNIKVNDIASLLVVRLADGASWIVPGSKDWYPAGALAVTCDDVFLANVAAGSHLVRIRLDSLGPAIAPD